MNRTLEPDEKIRISLRDDDVLDDSNSILIPGQQDTETNISRVFLPDLPAERVPTLQLSVVSGANTLLPLCNYKVSDVKTRPITIPRDCPADFEPGSYKLVYASNKSVIPIIGLSLKR